MTRPEEGDRRVRGHRRTAHGGEPVQAEPASPDPERRDRGRALHAGVRGRRPPFYGGSGGAQARKGAVRLSLRFSELESAAAPIDRIILEVQRSIDYYRAQTRDREIQRVLLAGGGALLPGLSEHAAQFFDSPVEIDDPFAKVRGTAGTGERPLAGAPVRRRDGPGAPGGWGMKDTVNLLPREIRRPAAKPGALSGWPSRRDRRDCRRRVEAVGAVRRRPREGPSRRARDAVQAEIAKINAEIAPFRQAAEVQRGEAAALSTLRERAAGRTRFSAVLGEVGRLAPPSLWLSSLESKPSDGDAGQTIDLKGAAYSHENVTAFVSSLERSRLFSNVTLVYAERGAEHGRSAAPAAKEEEKAGGVGFHISARIVRSPLGTRG